MMNELELQAQIRLALGKRTDCCFFRNAVGTADTHGGHKVSYGLGRGSADLVGMLRPSGRFVGLEIKTATGRVSEDQKNWIRMINIGGGYARVVRSVQDAMLAVDQAQECAANWTGKTYSGCAECFNFGTVSGPTDDDGQPTEKPCPRCRI